MVAVGKKNALLTGSNLVQNHVWLVEGQNKQVDKKKDLLYSGTATEYSRELSFNVFGNSGHVCISYSTSDTLNLNDTLPSVYKSWEVFAL